MEKYTTPEQCQDLEDICTLLQDKGSKQFSRKYSSLPPIIKWFDVLEDSLVVDDPFKTNFKTDHYNMLVPNILRLLRFCFLTRKDVPTVTLLSLLTDEPQKHIDVIWKGVLEVAYHNPDRYKPFFFQLVNQLKSLYEVNAKEILLEYLLFVLHQGDINEAKQFQRRTMLLPSRQRMLTSCVRPIKDSCTMWSGYWPKADIKNSRI